jgi:hypothetical protein
VACKEADFATQITAITLMDALLSWLSYMGSRGD